MDPETLLSNVRLALHRGAHPADVNDYIQQTSGGKFGSIDDLQQHLAAQDQQVAMTPSAVRGAIAKVGQGLIGTGLLTRASGALDALLSRDPGTTFGERYDRDRALAGAELSNFADPTNSAGHPTLSGTSRVGGALLPIALSMGAAAPATAGEAAPGFFANALKGAGVGASFGAAGGAADAPDYTNVKDVGERALTGGVLGGAFGAGAGAVLPPAISALTRIATPATERAMALLARYAPSDAADIVARMQQMRPGTPILAADAMPEALRLTRNASPDVRQALAQQIEARTASGRFDLGNRLAWGLTSSHEDNIVPSIPDPAAVRLGENAPGASWLPRGADKPVTIPAGRYAGAEQAQQTLGRKLYGPFEENYPALSDENPEHAPVFDLLKSNPIVNAAYRQMAPQVDLAAGIPAETGDLPTPSFSRLQATYQQLRDQAANRFAGNAAATGPSAQRAAENLRTVMEGAFPGYRAANAQMEPAFNLKDAWALGPDALSKAPAEIQSDLANLTKRVPSGTPGQFQTVPDEDAQSAYRMAALHDLYQRVTQVGPAGDKFRAGLSTNPAFQRDRIAALVPNPQDLGSFLRSASVEPYLQQTAKAAQVAAKGSTTAARDATEALPPTSLKGMAVRALHHLLTSTPNTATADEVTRILSAQGTTRDDLLRQLLAFPDLQASRIARTSRLLRGVAPVATVGGRLFGDLSSGGAP